MSTYESRVEKGVRYEMYGERLDSGSFEEQILRAVERLNQLDSRAQEMNGTRNAVLKKLVSAERRFVGGMEDLMAAQQLLGEAESALDKDDSPR